MWHSFNKIYKAPHNGHQMLVNKDTLLLLYLCVHIDGEWMKGRSD